MELKQHCSSIQEIKQHLIETIQKRMYPLRSPVASSVVFMASQRSGSGTQ
jgi:hypothetical protein